MSEYLAAAAEKMGMPEALVMRSAQAKAKAGGVTVEDLLREWAGGGAAAPGTPTATAAEPTAAAAAPAPGPAPVAPVVTAAPTGPRKQVVARPDPDAAPLLVIERQSHTKMLLTIVAVLVAGASLGALLPTQAARQDVNGAIGSQPDYTSQAISGREVYLAEGCWTCHTMVVRATATDYGLGKVTNPKDVAPLSVDSLGVRRIGPDLTHVGSRQDPTSIYNFLISFDATGADVRHPDYAYLSDDALGSLTAFLIETK